MQLVKEQRKIADPYVWYIQARIMKSECKWKNHPLIVPGG